VRSRDERGTVHLVVPERCDDVARPSGGSVYDRRVQDALIGLGWKVLGLTAEGDWPQPSAQDLSALADLLATVPDGALVLVDGLVGSAAAEVLLEELWRLRLVPLVHTPLDLPLERDLLAAATTVVTTSNWTRDWLCERYLLQQERLHVAEPGTDHAHAAAGSADGGRLVCVAAVTPAKGQDTLLAALSRLPDLPWTCTLIGSLDLAPDFVRTLRHHAVATGIADRVVFAGARGRDDVRAAYAGADALVLASRAETYGMVVTEALAHGLPVVATAVGGVPEALGRVDGDDGPGLLVRPDDPGALADALRRWLTDSLLRERLRRSARLRRLTLPGWEQTAARVTEALEAAR
jgi:glycosyltransferase involved in cell wall biosynthesis